MIKSALNSIAFFVAMILAAMISLVGCGAAGTEDYKDYENFKGPTRMAITPDYNDLRGTYIYVINSQGDTMSVVDAKFRRVVAFHNDGDRDDVIYLGDAPHDLAITNDGTWLYVTDASDGLLRRVAAHSPFVVTETDIVARAGKIIIPSTQLDPRFELGYIACPDTLELIRFVVGSDVATVSLPLPGKPKAIAASKDGDLLFITTEDGELLFVRTDPFELLSNNTLFLSGRPGRMAVDKDGENLFVLNNDPPQVQVIDLYTRTEVETEITFDYPLADLALDPYGEFFYVTSQNGQVFPMSPRSFRACGARYERVFFRDKWPTSDPRLVDVQIYDCVTKDEEWYIEYNEDSDDWSVEGTYSGWQTNRARTNQFYLSDDGRVGFTILPGDRYPTDGDMFHFETFDGIGPVTVGQVPDGIVTMPDWDEPEYIFAFIANTGTNTISVLHSEDQVLVDTIY